MRKAAVLTEEQQAEKKERMKLYQKEYREQNRDRLLEYSRQHNRERYQNYAAYRENQLAKAKERYRKRMSGEDAIIKRVEHYVRMIEKLGYTVAVEKAQ